MVFHQAPLRSPGKFIVFSHGNLAAFVHHSEAKVGGTKMKTKLIAALLLGASAVSAAPRINIEIGAVRPRYYRPVPAYVAPAPVYSYAPAYVPAAPEAVWVEGYWYSYGPHRVWRPGYWSRRGFRR